MGVEEEEEEGPVRVQRGNQHKPESAVDGGSLAVGRSDLLPLTCLTSSPVQSQPSPLWRCWVV